MPTLTSVNHFQIFAGSFANLGVSAQQASDSLQLFAKAFDLPQELLRFPGSNAGGKAT